MNAQLKHQNESASHKNICFLSLRVPLCSQPVPRYYLHSQPIHGLLKAPSCYIELHMFRTVVLKPPNKRRCQSCLLCLAVLRFLFFLPPWVQRMLGEAQAASRQELEQRPWLCWRLQGARLEIKPNKNVWFVAFIFGRCQLQFELARCLEAGCVTNMKDALMNCWQSSVSSLIHYMMAMKTSAHCFTGVWPQLMVSIFIHHQSVFKKKAIWFI